MVGILTGPALDKLQSFFVPAVCLLISFLGYTSQWLFNTAEYLEPGPLTQRETAIINTLLACLWWTYYKACTVSPGRYNFPLAKKSDDRPAPDTDKTDEPPSNELKATARWCKKCNAPKPLRAHHCRHCKTCIPKMDHHCPWTNNCVSLQTFPYFLRFLVYTNFALWYFLCCLLHPRLKNIFWDNSTLPSYLGPSIPAMVHLVLLGLVGFLTAGALFFLLVTTAHGWVMNTTMIEGWEQERHEAVLLRSKKGGWWSGDGDQRINIHRVEFPYDIGFFQNMAQAMGTRNVLTWLDPILGGGPKVSQEIGKGTGWEWEENGYNDRVGMWPPTDPDKLRRAAGALGPSGAAAARQEAELVDRRWANPAEEVAAFRARQEMDLRRRTGTSGDIAELDEDEAIEDLEYDYVEDDSAGGGYYDQGENEEDEEEEGEEDEDEDEVTEKKGQKVPVIPGQGYYERGVDGEPGWTNSEGDRLRDFGVDEDADSDEDVPLGELLRRRKAYAGRDG